MHLIINRSLILLFMLILSSSAFAQLGKLRNTNDLMQGVKTEIDSTLQGVKNEINNHLSDVQSQVDSTLSDVQTEVETTKSEIIDAIGEVTWRFTLVEIIMSLLATILTAFFTAYLTTKRLGINQFKEEIESILKESKDTIAELKKEIEGLKG